MSCVDCVAAVAGLAALSSELDIALNPSVLAGVYLPTLLLTDARGAFKGCLPQGVRNGRADKLDLMLLSGHLGTELGAPAVEATMQALAVDDTGKLRAVSLTNGSAMGKTWTVLSVLRVCLPWHRCFLCVVNVVLPSFVWQRHWGIYLEGDKYGDASAEFFPCSVINTCLDAATRASQARQHCTALVVSRFLGLLILLRVFGEATVTPESWLLFQYSRRNWGFFNSIAAKLASRDFAGLHALLARLKYCLTCRGVYSMICALDEAQSLNLFPGFHSQSVSTSV